MAQATYTQDTRQLLHFRRTLVSFRSRFSAKGWGWFRPPGLYRNPSKTAAGKTVMDQWCILRCVLMQQTFDFSMGKYYTEDMAENRRPTINSILKDPAASDWLKAAVRSALECDPADVMRDAREVRRVRWQGTSARRGWNNAHRAP